jgi:hypothetical protein
VAAEVTRDRNQKTESAEKEGGKQFWVYEINEDFRLMARPGLPAAFWFLALSRVRRGIIKGESCVRGGVPCELLLLRSKICGPYGAR